MVFGATLAMGVWASYDTAAALQRAALLGAGLALIPAGHLLAKVHRGEPGDLGDSIALIASAVAAVVAIAWFGFPGAINDNVGASTVSVLLPFGLAAIMRARSRRENARLAAHVILSLPSIAALMLAGSRGAWAGLAAAVLVVTLIASLGERGKRPALAAAITTGLVLFPIGVLAFSLIAPDAAAVLGRVSSTAMTRPALWADMLDQLGDVPFTGSGLAATMMMDATYVRLLHVGFISHAHHLYLQVALEQGLVGLVAFIGIQATALYLAIRSQQLAIVAAFTVLLVHGGVDAGLYVARSAPLLFFPASAAIMLESAERATGLGRSFAGWQLLAVTPVLLLFLLPSVRAALQANLGVVLQSRAELVHYSWPAVPIQDALRRDPAIDLRPAIARYEAALALDPRNTTAHRALGQIALARGNYSEATAHLEAAFGAAPTNRTVRQLLGELRAIAGDVQGACAMWQGLDLAQGQLNARRFWYEHISDAAKAAAIREVQNELTRIR